MLTVRGVLPTLNTATAPGGFSIPDCELLRVERLAAQSGQRIIALFHSHPGGSTALSESDCAALAHCRWPWLVIAEAAAGHDVVFELYPPPRAPSPERAGGVQVPGTQPFA